MKAINPFWIGLVICGRRHKHSLFSQPVQMLIVFIVKTN